MTRQACPVQTDPHLSCRHCYNSAILANLDAYLALDIANGIESIAVLWGCKAPRMVKFGCFVKQSSSAWLKAAHIEAWWPRVSVNIFIDAQSQADTVHPHVQRRHNTETLSAWEIPSWAKCHALRVLMRLAPGR